MSANSKFIKEVNHVPYSFVWNGKDKVKRLDLINSIEKGGLKMPDIESLVNAQRVVCIKSLWMIHYVLQKLYLITIFASSAVNVFFIAALTYRSSQ